MVGGHVVFVFNMADNVHEYACMHILFLLLRCPFGWPERLKRAPLTIHEKLISDTRMLTKRKQKLFHGIQTSGYVS